MSQTETPIERVVQQVRELGVESGGVLLVHTSFTAVRPIQGGPVGLIEALIRAVGPAGTVVMPSWPAEADERWDPSSTPSDPSLGVVADTFWRYTGTHRTKHVQAFAAFGPHADRILSDPLPLPPHKLESPVGRVYDLDGQVLLIGVNHDADTTIHLAEVRAGVPYGVEKECVDWIDGRPTRITYRENDHCCARFKLVDHWLRDAGQQAEGPVGHAHSRLVRSRDVVDAVVRRLRREPLLFLHSQSVACAECDEARASVLVE